MPSTSLLMSYTECPGGRLTTPPMMPFVLFLCNFITSFKMFCFNLVPVAPMFSLDILFLNPAFKNSPPHLHNPLCMHLQIHRLQPGLLESWIHHIRRMSNVRIQPCYNSCINLCNYKINRIMV